MSDWPFTWGGHLESPRSAITPAEEWDWPARKIVPYGRLRTLGADDRYELRGLIRPARDKGGQAAIWLATDHATGGRDAVVKVAKQDDDNFRVHNQRLDREARLLQRLASDPRVMTVLDSGSGLEPAEPSRVSWLVMPLVSPLDLTEVLGRADGHQLPAEQAWALARELAGALAGIHELGIVHRDLTPGNILLQADGLIVADLGMAYARSDPDDLDAGPRSTQLTELFGRAETPGWSAPELLRAAGTSDRPDRNWQADIYCWGLYVYCAVLGHHPWSRTSSLFLTTPEQEARRGGAEDVDLREFDRRAPSLRHLVALALAPDPAARPPARSLLEWLSRDGSSPAAPIGARLALQEPAAPEPVQSIPSVPALPSKQEFSGRRDLRPELAGLADTAASHITGQWQPELARRLGDTTASIEVGWRSAPGELVLPLDQIRGPLSELPFQFPSLRHPAEAAPGRIDRHDPLAGSGPDLANIFVHRAPHRRLVVLGDSGSGKSVLLVRLVLSLADKRASGAPVPILVSVIGWDPARTPIWTWIERKALEADPWLGDAGDPLEPKTPTFTVLRNNALILPVLDGLDEMSLPAMHLALRQIEQGIDERTGVVLASQTQAFRKLMAAPDARRLSGAPGIEITTLTSDDAFRYLIGRASTSGRDEWKRLQAGSSSIVTKVFASALMVSLADRIYNPGAGPRPGGVLAGRHPFELAGLATSEGRLADHLLTSFVEAAYPNPRRLARARRWLTTLASLSAAGGRQQFAWWELGDAVPAWWPALIVGLVGGVPAGIAGWINDGSGVGLGTGLIIALFTGLSVRRLLRRDPRWPAWMTASASWGLAAGLVSGLLGGMAGASFRDDGAFSGVSGGLGIGFGIGAMAGPVAGAVGAAVGGFGGELLAGRGAGAPAGLASGVAAGLILALMLARVGRRSPARGGRLGSRGLTIALLAGSVMSAALGTAAWTRRGPTAGILGGVAAFVTLGLLAGLTTPPAAPDQDTSAADEVFRADRRTFWLFALLGFTSGFLSIFLVNWRIAVCGGLAGALGLSFFQATWGRYKLACLYYAVRGRLPLALIGFLRDAHRRDVLRQVGARYDFRHAELRRHFERG